jgi:carboxymethylenebutenolidase
LYRGKVAIDRETAGHYMSDLNWQGAVQDIQASINWLKKKDVKKIGIVGFCMGGALSLAASVLCSDLDAAAVYYGIPGEQLADPGKAKTPLQLHFGSKDTLVGFSSVEDQEKLKTKLEDNKVDFEFFLYEGADHAFANDKNVEKYDAKSAQLSHERTLEFFKKYLNSV